MDLAVSVQPNVHTVIGRTGSQDDSSTEKPRSFSLSEFAESYENVLNENRDLACRLTDSINESARLKELHQRASTEFGAEKDRLNLEIGQLRAQLRNRLESVIAAKEKLMRDEFERKLQESIGTKLKVTKTELEQKIHSLQMELQQERAQIEKLKKAQSHCICRYRDVLPANWIKR
jgi:chromosome segregation ATPase